MDVKEKLDDATAAVYDVQKSVDRELGAIRSLLEQILDVLQARETGLPSTFTFEPEIIAPICRAKKTLAKMGLAT
jgi:hypothetical protein